LPEKFKINGEQISTLEKEGKIEVSGYEITRRCRNLHQRHPRMDSGEGKTTVALDLTITDELKAEGIAREFINRVQNLRKDKDFDLTDRISITLEENNPYRQELTNNEHIFVRSIVR
jgi:isoleucyl-tRNA synthetase